MSARTEAEAIREVTRRVQRAVTRVTPAIVRVGGSGATRSLLLNQGDPAPVTGIPQLRLSVLATIRPERQPGGRVWTARIAAYAYGIEFDGREVLRYDWHPDEPKDGDGTWVKDPHLHVYYPSGSLRRLLGECTSPDTAGPGRAGRRSRRGAARVYPRAYARHVTASAACRSSTRFRPGHDRNWAASSFFAASRRSPSLTRDHAVRAGAPAGRGKRLSHSVPLSQNCPSAEVAKNAV